MPNILIAHEDGENLKITGMVDVSDDLRELVGTSKERKEIVLEKNAGASLEQAIVDGLRSAREVLGGYVKFAKPIVLKGVVPAYVTEKLASITAETNTANYVVKEAEEGDKPCPGGKIRSEGKGRGLGMGGGEGPMGVPAGEKGNTDIIALLKQLMEALPKEVPTTKISVDTSFMKDLGELVKVAEADGLVKAAACPFVNNLFDKLEAEKVDGNAVGINVPCKIAFESPERRDFFLSLFPKQAATFSLDELAGQLVADGLVKGNVIERLAAAGTKKHAAYAARRNKAT